MIQHNKVIIAEGTGVIMANVTVWTMQDTATLAAIFLSIVSSLWVLAQLAKFVRTWWAEHKARAAQAEEVCRLRQEGGACPLGPAPPTKRPSSAGSEGRQTGQGHGPGG